MNYSLVKAILEGLWDVSPQTFIQYEPIARSIMNGLEFVQSEETQESIQYLKASSGYDSRTSPEEDKPKEGLIAITPLVGVMLKYDTYCGPVGTMTIAKRLEKADADPAVIGHILWTDTGGGESTSVHPLAETIENLKKPIIGYCHGYMCSAGIGVNVHCDEIYASSEHDVVGSVGTMIAFNARENESKDQDGNKTIRIYSSHSDDKNRDFEEAVKGNYKFIRESLLDPLALKFIERVKTNRPGIEDQHVTGKIFMAKEVVGSFIDGIKSFHEVLQRIVELSEERNNNDDTEENTLINNQNSETTMKQFPKINQALGVKSLESTDDSTALNTEQMEAIEAALPEVKEEVTTETPKEEVTTETPKEEVTTETPKEELDPKDEKIQQLEAENAALKSSAAQDTDIAVESDTKKSISKDDYFLNVAAAQKEMEAFDE